MTAHEHPDLASLPDTLIALTRDGLRRLSPIVHTINRKPLTWNRWR